VSLGTAVAVQTVALGQEDATDEDSDTITLVVGSATRSLLRDGEVVVVRTWSPDVDVSDLDGTSTLVLGAGFGFDADFASRYAIFDTNRSAWFQATATNWDMNSASIQIYLSNAERGTDNAATFANKSDLVVKPQATDTDGTTTVSPVVSYTAVLASVSCKPAPSLSCGCTGAGSGSGGGARTLICTASRENDQTSNICNFIIRCNGAGGTTQGKEQTSPSLQLGIGQTAQGVSFENDTGAGAGSLPAGDYKCNYLNDASLPSPKALPNTAATSVTCPM